MCFHLSVDVVVDVDEHLRVSRSFYWALPLTSMHPIDSRGKFDFVSHCFVVLHLLVLLFDVVVLLLLLVLMLLVLCSHSFDAADDDCDSDAGAHAPSNDVARIYILVNCPSEMRPVRF